MDETQFKNDMFQYVRRPFSKHEHNSAVYVSNSLSIYSLFVLNVCSGQKKKKKKKKRNKQKPNTKICCIIDGPLEKRQLQPISRHHGEIVYPIIFSSIGIDVFIEKDGMMFLFLLLWWNTCHTWKQQNQTKHLGREGCLPSRQGEHGGRICGGWTHFIHSQRWRGKILMPSSLLFLTLPRTAAHRMVPPTFIVGLLTLVKLI